MRPEELCDEDVLLDEIARESAAPAQGLAPGTFQRFPPVYFIGDSRAMPFRNAVYVSEHTARAYQLRSVHLRSLYAADLFSRERGLAYGLLNALATDQTVITHDFGATWNATPWDDLLEGTAPLVLLCGAYDVHRLMDQIGPDADILAWDADSRRFERSPLPASRLVDAEEALQRAHAIMEPLAPAIEALRTMGFARIFVHGTPPVHLGERFQRLYGHAKLFRQYHPNALPKASLLVDAAIRSIAARTSARYVSGPVDADGALRSELTSDDVHYNAEGAREVARSVVSVLEGVVE
jgi:hypothetical protein